MKIAQLLAALALALSACSPGVAEKPAAARSAAVARHPVSGLEVVPLVVRSGARVHRFRVELARTGSEQGRGLMFRDRLGANEGMLFPFDHPRMAAFWMKNTVISLDIIFIGTDGRILNIAANTVPYSLESVLSDGTAKAVLELSGGRAAQLGINAGDRVEW